MVEIWQLRQRQSLPLNIKIKLSERRIKDWYERYDGEVYVAFSGGRDSTALLHLVRSLYPNVPAVFCNTGLEFPEVSQFVKSINNVTWVKPKIPFNKVIEKYGYPIVSKVVSMGINRYQSTKSQTQRDLRLYGGVNPSSNKKQNPTIPQKWHYLVNAPFKISEVCCDVMKKTPFKRYEKETGRKPFLGVMASDSFNRQMMYLKFGCNAFQNKKPQSYPMGFWLQNDVKEYIKTNNVSYSKIYDLGYDHTGCVFCCFGAHMEREPNRFQTLKQTHPNLWNYCINHLDLKTVLNFINVKYE